MNKKTLIKLVLIFFVIINVFITYSYASIAITEASKYDITIENVPKDINKIELMIINKPSGEIDPKRDYLAIKTIPVQNIKNGTFTYAIIRDDTEDIAENNKYALDLDYCYGIKFLSSNNEKIITIDKETNMFGSTESFMYKGFNIKRVYNYSTGEITSEEESNIVSIPAVIFLIVLVFSLIFTIRNIFKLLIGGKKEKK